jgi:hypothetical protein
MSRAARTFPRHLAPRLREALRDTPAVLIHGPRQSGKSTLARTAGEARGYHYVSFDDDATVTAAKADPVGFVAGLPGKSILDEVQRVPEIFTALKTGLSERLGEDLARSIVDGGYPTALARRARARYRRLSEKARHVAGLFKRLRTHVPSHAVSLDLSRTMPS